MAFVGRRKSTFKAGDWNSIDDIDGQKNKRSKMSLNWKNQLVNTLRNFEPKHPQLTIRPRKEKIAVETTRTQSSDPALQDPPITGSDLI